MTNPNINDLRKHLMETLADLRNRDNPMEPDRARAVAQIASVIIDTAKVENDYLRLSGQERSAFLEHPEQQLQTGRLEAVPTANNPFPVSARHRLVG